MMQITYRPLQLPDVKKLTEIDASQYINKAWREVEGVRQLVDINYFDPTWPNGLADHQQRLLNTLETGGIAIGAFDESETLIAIVTVQNESFGSESQYVLLDQLFISKPYRGKGIGRQLLKRAGELAKQKGAEKLYICAGSAEETIAFYLAVGCTVAQEINQQLYEDDPRDYQLEYKL